MKIREKVIRFLQKGLSKEKRFGEGFGGIFEALGNTSAERYKSYTYACINARAENIAKARIFLYKVDPKTGKAIEITKHSFIDLLEKPNRKKQTFKEILHKISTSLDLYGNAYLYIHRGVKRTPIGLYYLPAKSIRIVMNGDNTEIDGYEYTVQGKTTTYKNEDVIHFTIPNPDSNIEGKATISAFNYTLDIDYYQNLYQRNFYLNDASLGLILETEEVLDETQFQRIESAIRQKYEGMNNTGKTIILEGGMKAKQYQNSPKDVEIIPARKLIRDEIMTIFRVPKTILGITEEVNRANARESLKTFNDYVIKPFAKICFESKFNQFLAENFKDEKLRMTMEYEFEIDRDLQLKSYEIYSKYGIADREEIREMEGL